MRPRQAPRGLIPVCGIAAVWRAGSGPAPGELVRTMIGTLHHRGPDDAAVWSQDDAGVALGHARLAILDLSPAGRQPMVSADGRWVLVFNGEIYNHRDLRRELLAAGERFRGHCDAEVLLASVARHGLQATLDRANGMFAFALWDTRERRLLLARDRLGEKPLYHGCVGGDLVVASELRAFEAHPGFACGIDPRSVASLLHTSCVPAPYSIYRGIGKLAPGTCAEYRAAGAPARLWRFWRVPSPAPRPIREEEAIEQGGALLADAVALRRQADVPLGAFLSGGVDSALIASLSQAAGGEPLRTFSAGFHDPVYDEAPHAERIAGHLGTRHTSVYVGESDALAVVPQLARIYDEPFADASQIPTVLISRVARAQVTVALSGDGGDECFGGYHRHFLGPRVAAISRAVPAPLRRAIAAGLGAVPPHAWDRVLRVVERALPRALTPLPPGERLHKLASVLEAADARALYDRLVSQWQPPLPIPGHPLPWESAADALHWQPGADTAGAMMQCDLAAYLPDDLLVKLDRASMSVGLEARVPFLDHRVVEWAAGLPVDLKIRGRGKWILRRILARHLPPALFERGKRGFAVPLDAWLRGPLREWAAALLDPQRLAREGIFEPAAIAACWSEHLGGARNRQYDLWPVLMFQAWWQERRAA
ncbi:MAG: asparagine synthase (glutamine-hydrolyzing) [Gammaproteobacteria bacterium]